jgi:hypothetical protein
MQEVIRISVKNGLSDIALGFNRDLLRLKPVNAERLPTFRVSAIMKLFYYGAIKAVILWFDQGSNRMRTIWPHSIVYPTAFWTLQFKPIISQKTSSILNVITSALIHLPVARAKLT